MKREQLEEKAFEALIFAAAKHGGNQPLQKEDMEEAYLPKLSEEEQQAIRELGPDVVAKVFERFNSHMEGKTRNE